MKDKVIEILSQTISVRYGQDVSVELERPEEQFGDWSTNIAMKLAGPLQRSPRDLAQEIVDELQGSEMFSAVGVAGPGFINLTLSDEVLLGSLEIAPDKTLKDLKVLVEYSDPNPFKPLHAGHLYTSIVGDVIARLVENAGAKTVRLNFGGDVGMHVGKTMYGVLNGEHPDLSEIAGESLESRMDYLGKSYSKGNTLYDENVQSKIDINLVNKIVYSFYLQGEFFDNTNFSSTQGIQIRIEQIRENYELGKKWSYDFFKDLYKELEIVAFDRFIPESEVAERGLKVVREHTPSVFKESDGAIVFEGELYGLHTRVFINNEGLPTYEAKDVGLSLLKWEDYHFDESIIITANEQTQYMQVVIKAIEQFAPEPAQKTKHLTHGVVKLAGGVKMSSRAGNILGALDILQAAREAGQASGQAVGEDVVLAAVKYSFLKNRIGGDVVYDPQESITTEGNSGPYLQYAHARACSILTKADKQYELKVDKFERNERSLALKLSKYAESIELATNELAPHHICTYLFELSQTFNRFYESTPVIGSGRQSIRLALVKNYADTLRNGLALLGISAPDSM